MRTLIITLVLLTATLAPPLGAAAETREDIPPMPDDYIALAREWVADLREDAADFDPELRANVTSDLDRADDYLDAGRFRSAFTTIVYAHSRVEFEGIWSEIEALDGGSARRARLIDYGDRQNARADDAYESFRGRLNELDGQLTSILAMESALYAAAIAMDAVSSKYSYGSFREQVRQTEPDVEPPLVRGVIGTGPSPAIVFSMTEEMLTLAEAREGILPRADLEAFRNFTRSLRVAEEGSVQMHIQPFQNVIESTIDTDEYLLTFSAWSALERADGIFMEQFRFGDAQNRGVGAVRDLHDNLNNTLGHPILESFESRGFEGLLARDAFDYAWAAKDGYRHDVGTFARAWIDLYHANATAVQYGAWSPVGPASDGDPDAFRTSKKTTGDASGVVAGAFALAGVALVAGLVWYARRK